METIEAKSKVEEILDQLDSNVGLLQKQLNELVEKLQPLLKPSFEGSKGVSGIAGMSGNPSWLLEDLQKRNNVIQHMTFTLNSVLQRLKV